MTARVPCEKVELGQIELVDEVGHSARVLVSAVEEYDAAANRVSCGGRRA